MALDPLDLAGEYIRIGLQMLREGGYTKAYSYFSNTVIRDLKPQFYRVAAACMRELNAASIFKRAKDIPFKTWAVIHGFGPEGFIEGNRAKRRVMEINYIRREITYVKRGGKADLKRRGITYTKNNETDNQG